MARSFNGSTQYLYRGSGVVTSVPLTMCCWFKKSSLTTDSCLLYVENQSDHTYVGLFARSTAANGNKIQGIVSQSGVGNAVWNGSTYAANEWHFAAIRCNSSTSRAIWYDTTKTSDTTSLTVTSVFDEFAVGRWDHLSPALYFDGAIAEIGCWSAALDDAELEGLSKAYTPDEFTNESRVGYYPLGGHYGRNDSDWWKNKYDLTAFNSPTFDESHCRIIYPVGGIRPVTPGAGGGGGGGGGSTSGNLLLLGVG